MSYIRANAVRALSHAIAKNNKAERLMPVYPYQPNQIFTHVRVRQLLIIAYKLRKLEIDILKAQRDLLGSKDNC